MGDILLASVVYLSSWREPSETNQHNVNLTDHLNPMQKKKKTINILILKAVSSSTRVDSSRMRMVSSRMIMPLLTGHKASVNS